MRKVGPVSIYALDQLAAPYSHRPLIGWMLLVMNHLVWHGFTFPFLIRVPASIADVVTTILIFELLRARRSLREATAAALLVTCSPAASGGPGSTSPVVAIVVPESARSTEP